MKMISGGVGSLDEAHLMVMEKMHAVFDAGTSLWLAAPRTTKSTNTWSTSPQTRNDRHINFY
jgi:hypothetical protein